MIAIALSDTRIHGARQLQAVSSNKWSPPQ
jgi:hypothetical protein